MKGLSLRLRELPLSARVLCTCFLAAMAAGFATAQVNLHLQHGALDGERGLSLRDVEIAFGGRPGATLLAAKIDGGSMEKYIPRPADRATLLDWVAAGAGESSFEAPKDVLDRLCVRCHNPGGEMSRVAFARTRAEGAQFGLVAPTTEPDRGVSYASLARSSHAHLFGMGALFALAGLIFLMSDAGPRAKAVIVALPYVAMFVDIGSWWLTKLHAAFALGVVGGGVLLGLAFAVLILRPLWELWTPTGCSDGLRGSLSE